MFRIFDHTRGTAQSSSQRAIKSASRLFCGLSIGVLAALPASVQAVDSITGVLTDYSTFWESYENDVNGVALDSANNLLAFESNGVIYSTGVNDSVLIDNNVAFSPSVFKALRPVSFVSNNIGQGALDDGDETTAVAPIYPIADKEIVDYLTDGTNGLGFASFGNNVGATVNFVLVDVEINALPDAEPEFLYFNMAFPSSNALDFKLFDANDVQIGTTVSVVENAHPAIGTIRVDRIKTFAPHDASETNSAKNIEGFAILFSDFGIDASQLTQAVRLEVTLPPQADPPFVAFNANSMLACTFGDADSDNMCDLTEGTIDSDGDGTVDSLDTDSDNDGIPDIYEGSGDSDSDGVADYLDIDSDGDGIPDNQEDFTTPAFTDLDSDSDGIDDSMDVSNTGGDDANGNGFDDAKEPQDTDADGIPDHLDSDSDGDSLNDALEDGNTPTLANADDDNDGIDNALDVDLVGGPDVNNNGVKDELEPTDTDADNIPDYLDTDSDADGVPDDSEGSGDSDGDNIPDYLDDDDDNDGIANSNDPDDDNDGISDIVEGIYNNGFDEVLVNNNGFEAPGGVSTFLIMDIDSVPHWETNATDQKAEIWADGYNGVPAHEGEFFAELNANQVASLFQDIPTTPGSMVEWSIAHRGRSGEESATVSIGVPGGALGVVENMTTGTSAWIVYSGTYVVPAGQTVTRFSFDSLGGGSSGNFIDDFKLVAASLDDDGDGIANHLDIDSDNDGIADIIEGAEDSDGDGNDDYRDTDSDSDGLLDSQEDLNSPTLSGLDDDADGIDNLIDVDFVGGDDNNANGISDTVEPTDTDGDGLADYIDIDSDGDGLADITESDIDTDADNIGNYRDLDSDGDGIADSSEGRQPVLSTLSFSASTAPATAGLTTPATSGFGTPVITLADGVLSLSSTSPGESSQDSSAVVGTISTAVLTLNRDPAETMEFFTIDMNMSGGFDDGIYLEIDGVVVVDFDQTDWNISDVSSRFGNGGLWTPWNNMGNPVMQFAINNTGATTVEMLVDRTDLAGVRSNILEYIPGATPNAVPVIDIESGVALGIAFTNHGGAGGISDVALSTKVVMVSTQGIDSDLDTIADYLDLDSDNDGISDLYESGSAAAVAADANADGLLALAEADDTDGDGLADIYEGSNLDANTGTTPLSSDSDTLADYIDLDSDGDSLPDAIEAQASVGYAAGYGNDGDVANDDSDGDGVIDSHDTVAAFGGSFNTPVNTDGADLPDYLDLDSDNDLTTDFDENGADVTTAPSYADPDGNINDPQVHLTNEGNDTTEVAYREDATAPGVPTIVVAEDANNNGVVNAAELAGNIDLMVTLPNDARQGDTLQVSDGTNSVSIVLSAAHIDDGTLNTALAAPTGDAQLTYTANVTDLAGNTSPNASDDAEFDITPTAAPVVVLSEDSSDDGLISNAELMGLVDVTVQLPLDAEAGDTLEVDDGLTTNAIVLDADDITAGQVATTFAAGDDGDAVTVSASITDAAGNTSTTASDQASYDTSAPDAPTVVIDEDANDDALISSGELSGDINVTVTLPANAIVGDTLAVGDGTATNSIVLSSDHIDAGSVATTFTAGSHEDELQVVATLTDVAGNESAQSTDGAIYDLIAPPAATVVITEDTDDNGWIGIDEMAGAADVTVALPVGVEAGATLSLSSGSDTQTVVLSASDIANGSVGTTFPAGADGDTLVVTAILQDLAGNQGPTASDSATHDLVAPQSPVVLITEDTDDNALIGAAELADAIDVSISLPADAVVGDTLSVSDGDTTTQFILDANDIAATTVATTFAAGAHGDVLAVSANLNDVAGNVSPSASDAATLDLQAPALISIVIDEDANNDGLVSGNEANGASDYTVSLAAGGVAGDRLDVTDGTTTNTVVLSADDIAAGHVSGEFSAPAHGSILALSATVIDAAGNQSASVDDSATYDLLSPDTPIVVITEDSSNDGTISSDELTGQVDVTVTLPATASAGDTVRISDGVSIEAIVLTTADITAGSVSTTFAAGSESDTLAVTAIVIDPSGNESASASDSAGYDFTAPSAPVVTIAEDADDNGLIGNSELSGAVDISIALPSDVVAGDTLTINDGDTVSTVVLSPADISAGTVAHQFLAGQHGVELTVTAVVSDPAGNQSASAIDTATFFLDGPPVPAIAIVEDGDDNALIGADELSGLLDVLVTLPVGVQQGHTLVVSDGSSTESLVLTAAQISAGTVAVEFTAGGHGETVGVSAILVDTAGNESAAATDSASYDLIAPLAATITITEDLDDDGFVSLSEALGDTDVQVTLPNDAVAGDVVTVSDSQSATQFVLTAADIANTTISTSFAAPADGESLDVSVTVTDLAGNQSVPSGDSALYDLQAPGAPVIVLTEDSSDDGLISDNELSGDVDVTVTLPVGVEAGDTLSIDNGDLVQSFELTASDIASGSVSTTFAAGSDGDSLVVSAVITDPSGNASSGVTDSASYDVTAPALPVVEITEDANNDEMISIAESVGEADVRVALPADAEVGDQLAVDDGTDIQTFVLSAGDLAAGEVLTAFAPLSNLETMTISASVTDVAGNRSAVAMDQAIYRLSEPDAPVVTIAEDADNNALIGIAELNGPIDVVVALPNSAGSGDTLTISDGTNNTDVVLTDSDIAAGTVASVLPAGSDSDTVAVSALITDDAGNVSSPTSDAATLDLLAPELLAIVIEEDINNDGSVSDNEANGLVDTTVSLGVDVVEGDIIETTDGHSTVVVTVSADDIAAGQIAVEFTSPAHGSTIEVSATVSDAAGNVSAGVSDAASFDLVSPLAPLVVIAEDIDNDGLIGSTELKGLVDVTINLPTNASVNDTLTTTAGGVDSSRTLSAGDISSGVVATAFAAPADGEVLTVSALVTDTSGNVSPGSTDVARVDLSPPATPTIAIDEDANNDGLISLSELDGLIDVTVALPAGAALGDTVTITDGDFTSSHVLTADDLSAGAIAATVPATTNGASVTASATLTDAAGNTSAQTSDSAGVDTDAPGAPLTVIVEDSNDDGLIGLAELSGDVDVQFMLPAGAQAGDRLEFAQGADVTRITLSSVHIDLGVVSTSIQPGTDGQTLSVSATLLDPAGNHSAPSVDTATLDLAATDAPLVVIVEDANDDEVISQAESQADVDVSIALPGQARVGDTLLVDNGNTNQSFVLDALEINTGTVSTTFAPAADGALLTVSAVMTDAAGNQSDSGTDRALFDLSAPGEPVLAIVEDIDNDGIISFFELQGTVDVTIALPASAISGDTLDVSDGSVALERILTDADIADGQVQTSFEVADISAAVNATATLTDAVGNRSDESQDQAVYNMSSDTDGDGIVDRLEGDVDTDGDGIVDYLDPDSDNDGIPDALEDSLAPALSSLDTDGDGIDDALDVDATGGDDLNANGFDDAIEPLDSDKDGTPDHLDRDSDNDGIADIVEAGSADQPVDSDGDGIADYIDIDADNDNIPDALEDTSAPALSGNDDDADGIDNSLDVDLTGGVDDNGNGIDDAFEPSDTDGDGVADFRDQDSDGDSIPDFYEGTVDTDTDGRPDYLDTDSDGDGIDDSVEDTTMPALSGNDTDHDGIDDSLDVDQVGGDDLNANGISDSLEPTDTDGDGEPNHRDIDSDGDSIEDSIESSQDSDGDGVANYLDIDSDNDGIADEIEGPADSSGDTNANYTDTDSDDDGIPDLIEGSVDSDGDGIADFLDTDSDNDGIDDAVEDTSVPTLANNDTDADGIDDAIDVDLTQGADENRNGIDDAFEPTDTDGDGIADYLDIDSDADGIADLIESTIDTDTDGTPDYRDTDSDGDGIDDAIEDRNAPLLANIDSDADGIDDALDVDISNGADANGNGIDDAFEPVDHDGDGTPDHRDTDSDNDGIIDLTERNVDSDLDGTSDYLDRDSDGDGVADLIERNLDSDADGIADYLDLDSDNDSIADADENALMPRLSGIDSDHDGIDDAFDASVTGGADVNGNGIDDRHEPVDSDGDGIANYLDIDSDDDGISDAQETLIDTDSDGLADYVDLDSDGDGLADALEDNNSPQLSGSDNDGDGIDDAIDVDATGGEDLDGNGVDDSLQPADNDSDGIPNHLDLDSDGDSVDDSTEAGASGDSPLDTDGDGVPNFLDLDSDGDGTADRVEASLDLDRDNIPDIIDVNLATLDTDGDGLNDLIEGTIDTDGDGKPDFEDLDSDADDIPDAQEAEFNGAIPADRDGDGIHDYIDIDADNDGISDVVEGNGDRDGDGVPDYRDLDTDNDGIFDLIEARIGQTEVTRLDANNDGVIDPDTFNYGPNGMADVVETVAESGIMNYQLPNVDDDSRFDFRDHDSDNDGILDTVESRHPDIDYNGLIDDLLSDDPALFLNDAAVNESGVSAEAGGLPINSDTDGLADFRDSDSDNDGLTDAAESVGPELDADSDGRIDGFVDSDNDGVHDGLETILDDPIDTDSDGIADHLDSDSDQDGINDLIESGGADVDGDGEVDNFVDLDQNGYDDGFEQAPLAEQDSDGDGEPDHQDLDSDNDGVFDIAASGNFDVNRDGVVDAAIDADRDGIIDTVDVDFTGGSDLDGDGIDDSADADFSNEPDTDNDGIVDSQDADADGDGFVDPRVGAAQGVIRTGLTGGAGSADPRLLILLLISVIGLMVRRRRSGR